MRQRNFITQNKYKNKSCTVDGIAFHSRKEAAYYGQLKIEQRAGLIKSFQRQVSFDLLAYNTNGHPEKVCSHIVDFLVELPNEKYEVREVKGFSTAEWNLKRKLFEANYEIPYKIVR